MVYDQTLDPQRAAYQGFHADVRAVLDGCPDWLYGYDAWNVPLPEAYIYHHFFEFACRAQVGALAGGAQLVTPSAAACEERAKQFGRIGAYDSKSRDWVASMALVEKLFPDYKE